MSERQLKAVMFTDIVGYTAMMQSDEQLALSSAKQHEKILNKFVPKYGGVVQQMLGDGCLCLFDSAVSATECPRQSNKKIVLQSKIHR